MSDLGLSRGRAKSLDRGRRRDNFYPQGRSGTLPADIRRKNKAQNDSIPFADFTSLRRGFTLNGIPIKPEQEVHTESKVNDDLAGFWWGFYIFILALTVGNLITSILLLRILRVGFSGLEHLEVLNEENEVRFWGDVELDHIVQNGALLGYKGENVELTGQVRFQSYSSWGPQLHLDHSAVSLLNIHDINLKDPVSKDIFFSTSDPYWKLPQGLDTLLLEVAEVGEGGVVAPLHSNLLLQAQSSLEFRGVEGLVVEGGKLNITSEDGVLLESMDGAVQISGALHLDALMLPIGGTQFQQGTRDQFTLCACGTTGKLFKVAVVESKSRGCQLVRSNPCL